MEKFIKHFRMNERDAIEYAKLKTDIFNEEDDLICKEIGDGNINYIFKIFSKNTNKSLIIKQADTQTRSTGGKLDKDRNRLEAEILILQHKLTNGMVPDVYFYDEVMSCLIMEDLSDYQILREALCKSEVFESFAENITDFLIKTLLPTTDLVLKSDEKKNLVKRYTNIGLCEITERLVYTEPYLNESGRNSISIENEKFVFEQIYNDYLLHLEVAKLKNDFMTNAQALIHGDLHTGSIFVKKDSIKVIDPEFAFYGPMGYDVGNVIANLYFSWIKNLVDNTSENKVNFNIWISKTISLTIDLFKEKFICFLNDNGLEKMSQTAGFYNWYLDRVLEDTSGVAGLELIRRILGSAKVMDIESIEKNKVSAEKIGLLLGKELIINRDRYKKGEEYVNIFERITRENILS